MMEHDRSEHCLLCGTPLEYHAEGADAVCGRCGRHESTAIICPNGHFICNSCHSQETLARLPELAERTSSRAPEDILEELLALPGLPMHGPEHHAMPALALLLASDRSGIKMPDDYIEEALRRSMQIPGGTCGYHGACGGAISLGVAVSIMTRATPLTGLARGLAQRASAMALVHCADDEARCCKRALRKTVMSGREFFADELGIDLPQASGHQRCADIARNRECAGGHCPYFRRTGKTSFQ